MLLWGYQRFQALQVQVEVVSTLVFLRHLATYKWLAVGT